MGKSKKTKNKNRSYNYPNLHTYFSYKNELNFDYDKASPEQIYKIAEQVFGPSYYITYNSLLN